MWLVPRKMGRDPFSQNFRKFRSKTRSRLLPKLSGSVRSNQKSFEKTGPPFEVDHFSRSHRSEFWLNGSHPWTLEIWADPPCWRSLQFDSFWIRGYKLHIRFIGPVVSQMPVQQITKPSIFKKNITLNFGKGYKETVVISFIPLRWAWEQGFFLYKPILCGLWLIEKTHLRTPRAKDSFFCLFVFLLFFFRQLSLSLNNMLNYPWTMHRRTGSNSDQILLENNSIADDRSKSAQKMLLKRGTCQLWSLTTKPVEWTFSNHFL